MNKNRLLGWHLKIGKEKKVAGWCNREKRTLSFSWEVLQHMSEEECMDTVYHEIAHALTLGGHTEEWRLKAIELGGTGEVKYDGSKLVSMHYNYIGYCPNGHAHYRHRLRKGMDQASCLKCSKEHDYRYLIRWVRQ